MEAELAEEPRKADVDSPAHGAAFALPLLDAGVPRNAIVGMMEIDRDRYQHAEDQEWQHESGAVFGTVHVRFPRLLRELSLHIMEDNAHHVAPGVPLYDLERMQRSVERSGAVEWDFSLPEYFKVCARCKLFHYEQGRWTDYESKTTSEPLLGPVPPTLRHS
jgi:fatty acid desaturase